MKRMTVAACVSVSLLGAALMAAGGVQTNDAQAPGAASKGAKRFVFEARNRRDPFEMRLEIFREPEPGPNPIQTLTLEQQQEKVAECERLSVEMVTYLQRQQIEKVAEVYDKITTNRAQVSDRELLARIDDIRQQAERQVGQLDVMKLHLTLMHGEDSLAKMKASFEKEGYQAVIDAFRSLDAVLKTAKIDDPALRERKNAIQTEAGVLSRRATIRLEFRLHPPIIGGVVIIGPNRSVWIDGDCVMEGEVRGPLTVHKIEKNKITFLYKEELIVRNLN